MVFACGYNSAARHRFQHRWPAAVKIDQPRRPAPISEIAWLCFEKLLSHAICSGVLVTVRELPDRRVLRAAPRPTTAGRQRGATTVPDGVYAAETGGADAGLRVDAITSGRRASSRGIGNLGS